MAFETLKKRLEENGFTVSVFATAQEAADYLNSAIDHTTVGCGGSMTLKDMGLYESLAAHNILYYHGVSDDPQATMKNASTADVYLLSANGIAESTGEIISIDGTGNRVASTLYGHRKVYFVAAATRSPRTLTAPSTGCATWWPPRTPTAWAVKLPAPSRATSATTATAPSASAAAWWSTTRR